MTISVFHHSSTRRYWHFPYVLFHFHVHQGKRSGRLDHICRTFQPKSFIFWPPTLQWSAESDHILCTEFINFQNRSTIFDLEIKILSVLQWSLSHFNKIPKSVPTLLRGFVTPSRYITNAISIHHSKLHSVIRDWVEYIYFTYFPYQHMSRCLFILSLFIK